MKQSIRVLLTGAGSPGAPGVIRSLRNVKDSDLVLIAVDASEDAAGFSMADGYYSIPKANDPRFIDALLEISKAEKIDVILPFVTKELLPLSQHVERFREAGTIVLISPYESLVTAIHKGYMLEHVLQAGIRVPKYHLVNTADRLLSAIEQLGYPYQPVCFKPVFGDGSRGFRILDAQKDRLHLLFHEKPNSLYISYPDLKEILKANETIPETLVMEYLPGDEYSVDMLADHGEVLVAIPRLREATVGGVSTKGVVCSDPDVIQYATQIVKLFSLHGNIGIQIRRDSQGEPLLLEINPRLQGTIVLCTAAGVNLPYLAVKLAMGMKIDPRELQVQWGTRMVRYWKEVFYDIHGSPYAL